jgi:hypothetical protein
MPLVCLRTKSDCVSNDYNTRMIVTESILTGYAAVPQKALAIEYRIDSIEPLDLDPTRSPSRIGPAT